MAIETPGNSTGTMDPVDLHKVDLHQVDLHQNVEAAYFEWDPEGSPVSIHMHSGVMDGIAHDVADSLPGPEAGGLLLGRVESGPRPVVWIERYQRIPCEHRFGPQFILDSEEITGLEKAAASVIAAGDLAVVGLY